MSDQTASRDLRLMVEAGLLEAKGEKRGCYYTRSPRLAAVQQRIAATRDAKDRSDPFAV